MNKLRQTSFPKQAKGLTLIETLIALLVLAVGLIGLAWLQASGLRNNHSAYLRTQATVLAHDVTDRMRANRTAALGGNYNIAIGAAPSGAGVPFVDLTSWKNALAQSLPAGDGSIAVNGNVAVIVVQWDDSRGGAPLAFQTQTEL